MSLSTNQSIIQGQFTSNGVSATINLPWLPSRFETLNITQFGSVAATVPVIIAEWRQGMPQDSSMTGFKVSGSTLIELPQMLLTDGVRVIDTSVQSPEAPQTGTAITNAGPAVVTLNSHGYIVGDRVRIFSTTGMFQIAGMDFTVTAVGGVNDFTLGFLDASGFAAPATAVTARRLINDPIYFPRRLFITNISQALQAVVTMSVTSGLSVGQIIRLKVPEAFGMLEADGLQGEIVAINTGNNTITLNIDSSGFTAFSFPTSVVAASAVDFPLVVPFGDQGQVLAGAQTNVSAFQAILGVGAIGGNNDVMVWTAERGLTI